jgi:pyruvate,water dikinase
VQTPLGWTFWDSRFELAMRGSFHDLGVFARSDVRQPRTTAERFGALFFGRYACSVDMLCSVAARMPGTSAREVELAFLGSAEPSGLYPSSKGRYPIIAGRMLWTALHLRRRLRRLRAQTHDFWLCNTRREPPVDDTRARAVLLQARDRFHAAMRLHVSASWLAQTMYTLVARLATKVDRQGLERALATGYGSLEETRLVADLWELSRGRLGRDHFLDRHGYHGPSEGDMSSRSWREDARPVEALIDVYCKLDDAAQPLSIEAARIREREDREAELLARLPSRARQSARATLAFARHFIPLREVGKAAFLQTIDTGRAAARSLGEHLVRRGRLKDPEDIFLLTFDDVVSESVPGDAHALIVTRRETRARYAQVQLPKVWQGQPSPQALVTDVPVSEPVVLRGVGVSPGIVTAKVAVVTDLNEASIEPGEILVCEITDPGWAPLFVVAGGLIIDIGGPMSHGAIVARELGIPCIINVRAGTQRLRTGDVVRLDADAGVATRVQRA